MKGGWVLWMAGWLLIQPSLAMAAYENYREPEEKLSVIQVLGRGLGNWVGLPAELGTTLVREIRMHPKAWPVTYAPRLITNGVARAFSGANDIIFFPWVVPFSDDTSPWTQGLGLPDYPWQVD